MLALDGYGGQVLIMERARIAIIALPALALFACLGELVAVGGAAHAGLPPSPFVVAKEGDLTVKVKALGAPGRASGDSGQDIDITCSGVLTIKADIEAGAGDKSTMPGVNGGNGGSIHIGDAIAAAAAKSQDGLTITGPTKIVYENKPTLRSGSGGYGFDETGEFGPSGSLQGTNGGNGGSIFEGVTGAVVAGDRFDELGPGPRWRRKGNSQRRFSAVCTWAERNLSDRQRR